MTYIRYMAVGGFKSLRDWNLLELSPRVSVLVGGNGTGKSSLVEALLWALGEDDVEQLRVNAIAELVHRASFRATPAFKMEDVLFHTSATGSGSSPADDAVEVEEASVYVVLGEGAGGLDADEHDEACCCKRRTDQSARELPSGCLSLGRSVDRAGRDRWELDGLPADQVTVEAALARHGVDRSTVSVIRQGELERILAADDQLRARIISEAAGIGEPRVDDLHARRLDLEADREWLVAELDRLREGQTIPLTVGESAAGADVQVAAVGEADPSGGITDDAGEDDRVRLAREVVSTLAARAATPGSVGISATEAAHLLGLDDAPPDRRGRGVLTVDGAASRCAELEERLQAVERALEAVRHDEMHRMQAVRHMMTAAVERVAERADRYFQALVVGGSLRLTPADAGVVPAVAGTGCETPPLTGTAVAVRVMFPGQPEVHLDALSGGQRALVAFALGVAVLEESPSRLMVLDEVEPALDESNLRRFNELLQGIALRRQVLIVSHQRRTKDVGDVVFGVDHTGEGASGLLFRFEPATRRLVVFGRTRGNWLDRNAPELQADGGVALTGPRSAGTNVRWGR